MDEGALKQHEQALVEQVEPELCTQVPTSELAGTPCTGVAKNTHRKEAARKRKTAARTAGLMVGGWRGEGKSRVFPLNRNVPRLGLFSFPGIEKKETPSATDLGKHSNLLRENLCSRYVQDFPFRNIIR